MTGGLALPAALSSGDRVAVVATSSPVPATRLDAGLAVLRGWGLEVVEGPHLRSTHPDLPYLAAADEQRAADLADAWLDPHVRAVLVLRFHIGVRRMAHAQRRFQQIPIDGLTALHAVLQRGLQFLAFVL